MTSHTAIAIRPEESLPQMLAFAEALVKTGFLPQAIKTPAQAVAVILTGRELGIGPMQALRSINVIQGKPALGAELMLALFKARGGKAVWKESTGEKATLWLRHPNGDEHIETFTMEDAKRAGLLDKTNWKIYPKAMLRARCASAGLRAVAPDVTAGMYDPDELGSEIPPVEVEIKDIAPERSASSGPTADELSEKPKALQEPDETLPFEVADQDGVVIEYGDLVDEAETARVFVAVRKAGVTKKDFPYWYATIRGRPWKGMRVEDVEPLMAAAKDLQLQASGADAAKR